MDMIPKQDNLNKSLQVLAIFGQYDSPAFHMQSKNFVQVWLQTDESFDFQANNRNLNNFSLFRNCRRGA